MRKVNTFEAWFVILLLVIAAASAALSIHCTRQWQEGVCIEVNGELQCVRIP